MARNSSPSTRCSVLGAERLPQPLDPEPRCLHVELPLRHAHGFGNPKPVAVHEQQQGVVPLAMPTLLRRIEQALDLLGRQVIPTPFVGIDSLFRLTLYISTVGDGHFVLLHPQCFLELRDSTFYRMPQM
jgi:hypothetical protein